MRMGSSTTKLRKTPGTVALGQAATSRESAGQLEDMKREDATKFKSLTMCWEKGWRMKDDEWKMKVRSVGREYMWAEHKDIFLLESLILLVA